MSYCERGRERERDRQTGQGERERERKREREKEKGMTQICKHTEIHCQCWNRRRSSCRQGANERGASGNRLEQDSSPKPAEYPGPAAPLSVPNEWLWNSLDLNLASTLPCVVAISASTTLAWECPAPPWVAPQLGPNWSKIFVTFHGNSISWQPSTGRSYFKSLNSNTRNFKFLSSQCTNVCPIPKIKP